MREMSMTTPGLFQSISTVSPSNTPFREPLIMARNRNARSRQSSASTDSGTGIAAAISAVGFSSRSPNSARFGCRIRPAATWSACRVSCAECLFDAGLLPRRQRPPRRRRTQRGEQEEALLFHQLDVGPLRHGGGFGWGVEGVQGAAHAGAELHDGRADRAGEGDHLAFGVGRVDEPHPERQQPQDQALDQ